MTRNRIWVGRLGEPAIPFTLEQIKDGAVRDSGLFPELYESPWPEMTTGVLATGVDRKYREHLTSIVNGKFAFPLYLPPALFPKALEDSKEAETDQSAIAKGKLDKSFIAPFIQNLDVLKGRKRQNFINSVTERAGVPSLEHLVAISDDRNSIMDPAMLLPLYGDLQDHWNDQVREIFSGEHLVPGKRVKETDSAHYGTLNAVYLRQKASEFLNELGIEHDTTHSMDTTLCIAPVVPGLLPLPEQGLIIKAEGIPFKFQSVTEQDIEDYKNGKIFTHDDFNLIVTDEHPEGIKLAELKREYPDHKFLSQDFSPARAMTAFANIVGIPKRKEGERIWRSKFNDAHKPQTVVSNMAMLTAAPPRQAILDELPLPPHMRLTNQRAGQGMSKYSSTYGGFRDLREFEQIWHSGQAYVIQDPDNFEVPKNHGIKNRDGALLSEDDIRELWRLETDLMFAYLATMATQPGAANHIGRSVMVEKSYWEKRGQWHPDFCNLGLAGDVEGEAYSIYETEKQLCDGLEEFDLTFYKHNVPTPANDFVRSEKELLEILGIEDTGYVVSSYGSATSFIDKAYKDPEEFNYQLAKLGVTTNDGGGARSAMLGARMGNVRALKDGFNVLNIGIRSEKDVSPLEGNIEDSVRAIGFVPETDAKDKRHVTYADEQFHILKLNRLLQRQAPIAAMSDCATYFAGGNGTVVEVALTRLHNAKVRTFGQGLFPGYDNDRHTIPMVFVNHEFEHLGQKRGIFDVLNKPFADRAMFYDMHVFSGEERIERAVDFVKMHAAMHGYKLDRNKDKHVYNDFKLGLDGVGEPIL